MPYCLFLRWEQEGVGNLIKLLHYTLINVKYQFSQSYCTGKEKIVLVNDKK